MHCRHHGREVPCRPEARDSRALCQRQKLEFATSRKPPSLSAISKLRTETPGEFRYPKDRRRENVSSWIANVSGKEFLKTTFGIRAGVANQHR